MKNERECWGGSFKVGDNDGKQHEVITDNVVFGKLHVIAFNVGYQASSEMLLYRCKGARL